ncbi:MAG: Gfo/Idh/MocA family oxidoreductase [Lentisphaerae bacterium]|jgi:hypothetical protein|nr:Gfo/Idh/MocA family oxidoreductase [Lentisphaerota bacterium]
MSGVFNTDKRIRLGIWGLGRGQSFIQAANFLNIDVVAGCDIYGPMREQFLRNVPGAYCTDNEDDFLAYDMDAVLIATFLPDHSKHIIKALESGKHVMCEVTPFRTPAEGVRVVEAVEKSGKVFNLLENYPFSKDNMFLRKLWQDGFFGDFMYGEFEYLHEGRTLTYSYPNGNPMEPGYIVHNWRSSLNYHYYCTHSLGPAMIITGTRPVSVSAMFCDVTIPGYLEGARIATACPSTIKMDNGGLVRNMPGSTTNDYHTGMRIWGTRASAEKLHDGLRIRIGGGGGGPILQMKTQWPELAEWADKAGHGGGDFWELYYFAREVLTGEPAPWSIYPACDVTLPGILAIRSENLGGIPIQIPDFRDKKQREAFRNDNGDVKAFDPTKIFPEGHDTAITSDFSKTMIQLYPMNQYGGLYLLNRVMDGIKIYPHIADSAGKIAIQDAARKLVADLPEIAKTMETALKIKNAYPDSMPGKTIARIIDFYDIDAILNYENTIQRLNRWLTTLVF